MRHSRSGGGARRLTGVVVVALPPVVIAVPAVPPTPVAAGGTVPIFTGVHIGPSADTGLPLKRLGPLPPLADRPGDLGVAPVTLPLTSRPRHEEKNDGVAHVTA